MKFLKLFLVIVGITILLHILFYCVERKGIESMVLNTNPLLSFCSSHMGSSDILEQSCGKLTNANCKKVNCCVLAGFNGEEKCVAGNSSGPTYKSNPGMDYYYYQNKKILF